MKHDVFISYSRKDLAEVKGLVETLKRAIPGLTYWFDLTGIESGDDFQDRIISAIDNSKYVIFALSENSIQSTWTKDEVMYAKNTGKKIVPVLLKGAQLKGWFLFKFGRIDCIDITDREQMEKMVLNLSNWIGREVDDSRVEQPSSKRSKSGFTPELVAASTNKGGRLAAIWAFVCRYWRRILAWAVGVGALLFACFVLMLWWFLNSDYYNDYVKAHVQAYIANIQQQREGAVMGEEVDSVAILSSRATSTNSTTQKSYKVGDYYNVDGKEGVVFEVTSDGRHGKIISLNQTKSSWDDAKSWCTSLGSGWRLPTKEELQTIYRVKSTLNSTLAAEGDEFRGVFWSSNEYDSDCAWRVGMYNGSTYSYRKDYDSYVRAVSAF